MDAGEIPAHLVEQVDSQKLRPALIEIAAQRQQRRPAQQGDTLLAALAPHTHITLRHIYICDFQTEKFATTEAATVKHLQYGSITLPQGL